MTIGEFWLLVGLAAFVPTAFATGRLFGGEEQRRLCERNRHSGTVGRPTRNAGRRPPFDRPDSRVREDRAEARREHMEAHG